MSNKNEEKLKEKREIVPNEKSEKKTKQLSVFCSSNLHLQFHIGHIDLAQCIDDHVA